LKHRAAPLTLLVAAGTGTSCLTRATGSGCVARAAAAHGDVASATLCVLIRLEVAHVHFVFLFIWHNTFPLLLVLFSGCVSRAEELSSARHLFIWNQVVQAD
jgi:hypothetical protein